MTDHTPQFPVGHVPHYSQPGTLAQQLQAIDVYLDDPTRIADPEGAWQIARAITMPHARTWYVEMRAAGLSTEGAP